MPPGGMPPGGMPPSYAPYGAAPTAPPYAGAGQRFVAYFIDCLVGALFELPAIIAYFTVPTEIKVCTIDDEVSLCEVPTGTGWAIIIALGLLGTIGFLVVYCRKVAGGQSWGQKALSIRIVDQQTGGSITAWRVFGRQVCRIFSTWFCFLGYFWMLWDRNRQCWHDKLVHTVVVKV